MNKIEDVACYLIRNYFFILRISAQQSRWRAHTYFLGLDMHKVKPSNINEQSLNLWILSNKTNLILLIAFFCLVFTIDR